MWMQVVKLVCWYDPADPYVDHGFCFAIVPLLLPHVSQIELSSKLLLLWVKQ